MTQNKLPGRLWDLTAWRISWRKNQPIWQGWQGYAGAHKQHASCVGRNDMHQGMLFQQGYALISRSRQLGFEESLVRDELKNSLQYTVLLTRIVSESWACILIYEICTENWVRISTKEKQGCLFQEVLHCQSMSHISGVPPPHAASQLL